MVSDNATPEAEQRLHVIVESNDGFKIAEEDLLIRGPGNFLGVKQSGASQFKTAHLVRDLKTLEMAKAAAKKVFALDPKLEKPEHKILEKILTLTQESSERLRSG